MKRGGFLRKFSNNPTAETKRRIQTLVREIVILRDGGCILRLKRFCGGQIGLVVLQADHLIPRGNSATYGDTRLIVCVCEFCHNWKSTGSNSDKKEYDDLVRSILSQARVKLWDVAKVDSKKPHKMNWDLVEVALIQELENLKKKKGDNLCIS